MYHTNLLFMSGLFLSNQSLQLNETLQASTAPVEDLRITSMVRYVYFFTGLWLGYIKNTIVQSMSRVFSQQPVSRITWKFMGNHSNRRKSILLTWYETNVILERHFHETWNSDSITIKRNYKRHMHIPSVLLQ